jgi:hypothetical protein
MSILLRVALANIKYNFNTIPALKLVESYFKTNNLPHTALTTFREIVSVYSESLMKHTVWENCRVLWNVKENGTYAIITGPYIINIRNWYRLMQIKNRDSSVGEATDYGGSIPGRSKIFLFSTMSTLALRPTQPVRSPWG